MFKCDILEDAVRITPELMKLDAPPDAIFAVNDLTAAGALKALKQSGYRVPEDESVIGFTDGLVASVTDPPLTSVSQHGFKLGTEAMGMLLRRLDMDVGDYPAVSRVIPTELVVRSSTKALP